MTAYYVKSGAGAAEFQQSHLYSSGDKMVPAAADSGNNFSLARAWVWECTSGGTSAAANPTWPSSVIQDTTTVTSSGATFTARKPGYSSGTTANWSFATIYLVYIGKNVIAGDTIYVSNNHAEAVPGAYTGTVVGAGTNAAPVLVICVNDSVAAPTAVATGATLTFNATNTGLSPGFRVFFYGLTFILTGSDMLLGQQSELESCSFQVSVGSLKYTGWGVMRNCTCKFSAASQTLGVYGGERVDGLQLLAGGTSPTTLFIEQPSGSNVVGGADVILRGVDLTNAAAGINLVDLTATYNSAIKIIGWKLPAAWSGALTGNTPFPVAYVEAVDFDNSGTNYTYKKSGYGQSTSGVFHEIVIVRSGGATEGGVTAVSRKMVIGSGGNFPPGTFPHGTIRTSDIIIKNDVWGVSRTATIEFIHDSLTALNNDEIWMEVGYPGETTSPLLYFANNRRALVGSAAAQPSSAVTWTTTGLTNPNKQKLQVTFTPQLPGYIHARVYLCKASKTVYVDPVITLS